MEQELSSGSELSSEVSSADPTAGTSNAFEVDGRSYTADQIREMQRAQMRHDDYSRKTQSFAQERNQWNKSRDALRDGGLESDLNLIRQGRASIDDFKRVYHKDFHHYVDQLMNQQQNKPNLAGVDPAFVNEVNQIKQHFHQMQVDAIDKELDAKEAEYSKKYPYADPSTVYFNAESLLDAKNKQGLKTEITNKEWDNLWKLVNEKQSGRFQQYQSSLVKGQKTQNAKNKDVGAGGGIPGQAPKTAKNIKEATDMLFSGHLNELNF